MSENPAPDESLADEFKNLGQNISDLLRTAWDNPERKRVQDEIMTSFNDLGDTLKREAEHFAESPTGQRFKSDMEDFGERVRNAETREKVRMEVLGILQNANSELQNVIDKWSAPEEESAHTDDSTGKPEGEESPGAPDESDPPVEHNVAE